MQHDLADRIDRFEPEIAFEKMLNIIGEAFAHVVTEQNEILYRLHTSTEREALKSSLSKALKIAQDDLKELTGLQKTIDLTIDENLHLRLSGPIFSTKMAIIQQAHSRMEQARQMDAENPQRYSAYTQAVLALFVAIDAPLKYLTLAVEGPRGAIEFKDTLEALLRLELASAA